MHYVAQVPFALLSVVFCETYSNKHGNHTLIVYFFWLNEMIMGKYTRKEYQLSELIKLKTSALI